MPAPPSAPPNPSRSRIAVWILIAGLALMFVPLFFLASAIRQAKVQIAEQATAVQELLVATRPVPADLDALTQGRLDVLSQARTLQDTADGLAERHRNLPVVMGILLQYSPTSMTLTQIAQADTLLTLSGEAHDQTILMDYVTMLRASDLFERVTIQSLTLTAQPEPTPVPTTAPASAAGQLPASPPPPTLEAFQYVSIPGSVSFVVTLEWPLAAQQGAP